VSEILLAEDAVDDAERVMALLSQFRVENKIKWLDDGAKAMHYLKNAAVPPRILLLDIKLPRMTGFEILDAVRTMPAYDQSLRIVFSSLDDIPTIKEAYAHGAHTFLSKPLNAEDFGWMIKGFPRPWILGSQTSDAVR